MVKKFGLRTDRQPRLLFLMFRFWFQFPSKFSLIIILVSHPHHHSQGGREGGLLVKMTNDQIFVLCLGLFSTALCFIPLLCFSRLCFIYVLCFISSLCFIYVLCFISLLCVFSIVFYFSTVFFFGVFYALAPSAIGWWPISPINW